jgi:hypothetical protein
VFGFFGKFVSGIGVCMLFHNHTAAVSTWSHVEHVEKNLYTTPKQTKKKVASPKSNRFQLPSCGSHKNVLPT